MEALFEIKLLILQEQAIQPPFFLILFLMEPTYRTVLQETLQEILLLMKQILPLL